jgi:hypothetical protein
LNGAQADTSAPLAAPHNAPLVQIPYHAGMTRLHRYLPCLALMGWIATSLTVATAGEPVPESVPTEFQFARMQYVDASNGRRNFGRGWWQQDWSEAEDHFTYNLRRLTRVSVGASEVVRLTDENLFELPWLYATQTGYWDLDDEEVARLREYLLRGGFLMCDDFWFEDEYAVFAATMARVFPEHEIEELHDDDAVLRVVFTIDESVQIPGLRHLRGNGQVQELPPPQWFGIYDDNGRLMVGINYNQDVGDSWEHANDPNYPQPMTAQGYRFGVNYVTYAMTH